MASTRAQRVVKYIERLVEQGISAASLTKHKRIAAEVGADDDLTDAVYFAMMSDVAALAPPGLALQSGAEKKLSDLGLVGHAITSSGTLGQALHIWMTYSDFAGEPFRFKSTIGVADWSIEFQPFPILPPALARFWSEEWAASFWHFGKETTGGDLPGATIEFRHARQSGAAYEDFLPAALRFNAPNYIVRVAAEALQAPVQSRDDEMLSLLITHFAEKRLSGAGDSLTNQLHHYFLTTAGGRPTLPAAAVALGLSERTLNRRLAAEGTTFSRLLGDFRSEYIQALASGSRLNAKQLARAVGYKNHQSLRRAFVQWTGAPLGAWRVSQGPDKAKPSAKRR